MARDFNEQLKQVDQVQFGEAWQFADYMRKNELSIAQDDN